MSEQLLTSLSLLLFSLQPTLPAAASSQAGDRPIIVVIVADDLGFNDVGFHGGEISTPNIDALAGHGVILNRHYSQPSCTPSRTALLTGRYPFTLGMQGKPLPAGVPSGLPLSEKLFPEYFRELGYKSHLVGKWHVGYETWAHMPTRRGFDTFFGYLNGFVGYYDGVHTQSGRSGRDIRRNEEGAWSEVYGGYLTEVLTKEAVRLIAAHPSPGGLFLFLAHMAPHTGNLHFAREAPPGSFSNTTNRQIYAEMVRWLDRSVGEVVEALSVKGVLNNSIIVFMSDNGAPTYDALWGYSNHGSNWPLKGEKLSLHEGGVRTSAVIWSPKLQKAGISTQLFHITDWLPTLFSAAGGASSETKSLDGVNQWSSLRDGSLDGPRNEVLLDMDEEFGTEAIIRGQWKLIKNFQNGTDEKHVDLYYGESGRNSTYDVLQVKKSLVGTILETPPTPYDTVRQEASLSVECLDRETSEKTDCHSQYCLYSIQTDPTECEDRAEDFPTLVEELKAALEAHRSHLVAKLPRKFDLGAAPDKWEDYWNPWLGPAGQPASSASSLLSGSLLFFSLVIASLLYQRIGICWLQNPSGL